jgi:hypothetical protein
MEVADADIQFTKLKDLIETLALNSSEGLWIMPFRGIPATGMRTPLDLIYLDPDGIVIDIEESFLLARDVPWNPLAASVLALPCHTVYSSQTQPGDRILIHTAGEMVLRLERLSNPTMHSLGGAALLRETPLWSGGPGILELQDRSKSRHTPSVQQYEVGLIEPRTRTFKPPKNWLERWWFPDPRRAPREPVNDLAAYYWTGAPPTPHRIRDINSCGLYLVTEERWYPGTLVLMTLQRTKCGESKNIEHSIHVYTRAVRWDKDGVGFQFVLNDFGDQRAGLKPMLETVNEKALRKFLKELSEDKC